MVKAVLIPKLEVYVFKSEMGNCFSLYINDQYECTYHDVEAVNQRISFLIKNEVNRGLACLES